MDTADTYDLYAIPSDNLEAIRIAIEQALHIQFTLHEYDGLGGDYYHFEREEGKILLHFNRDAVDNELIDDRYPDCKLRLSVEAMPNYKEIEKILKEKIPGIILVEREQA